MIETSKTEKGSSKLQHKGDVSIDVFITLLKKELKAQGFTTLSWPTLYVSKSSFKKRDHPFGQPKKQPEPGEWEQEELPLPTSVITEVDPPWIL